MPPSWWIAVGMGTGIVILHVGIRLGVRWWTREAESMQFAVRMELAGMGGRMLLVLVLTALVLLYVPVPAGPFVVSLIGFLLLSIAGEAVLVSRRLYDGSSHA